MSNLIIGLTGGIGSGKTTVSDLFEELGVSIVDADVVAREVVELGSPALQKIHFHFGDSILQPDGTLDRAALRERIFSDNEQKDWLNQLLHPLIRETIATQLRNASGPYVLLVAPLLFENKLEYLVDRTLVVDVPVDIQISRTLQRDKMSSKEVVQSIINSQISRNERLNKANDIIDNSNESPASLHVKITQLHHKYIEISSANEDKPT